MKNILRITIAFVLLLTIGCSKEFLDPVPQTSLSDLSVFDTKDRIVAQVNGMYASMKSGAYQGGRFFVYIDVRADNFIPKSSNLVTNFASWNHTEVSSTNEVQNFWGNVYAAVNTINVFLDGLTAAWDEGKLDAINVSQAEYDQWRSEAYALRAKCYFDLLQLYCKPYNQGNGANPGVPLRMIAEKSSEGNDLARSTVAEVYTQILKDLNDAEPLAITAYSTDLLNTTRVHKNTIIALKTRVYLHMQDWAKVVTESAKIVSATAPFTAPSGVAFTLNPSFTNIFNTPYTSKESIFSMPMTPTNGPGTQNGLPHYYSYTSSESYYLNLNPGFAYALMDATDVRKTSLYLSDSKYFLTKFPDLTTLTNYAPVIRYAEVLLNRAEALVRAGGAVTQEAVDLLNAVRTRSFPTGGYTVASFPAASDFYNAVLLERNIEFLGEGIRTMDLQRLNLPFPAKDGGGMGVVPEIPSSSIGYIWPIPANELSLNKLMTPNE